MRLLVLGTGRMAEMHAKSFAEIDGVELVACVDIRRDAAAAFAQTHNIAHAFESLAAACAAIEIDAITNCTPDMVHFPSTMEALEVGLHVFCEKPLATNVADARKMAEAAKARGLIHGVNLTYRNVSALQAARAMVEGGKIGNVRHFEASYRQSWLTQPAWGEWSTDPTWLWRLSSKHGSLGVLGDVGIHIFDFATYAIGGSVKDLTGQLVTFDKAPDGKIGEYILDANDSFTATVSLEEGPLGVVHASRFASGHLNDLNLQIHGDKGALKVTNTGDLGTLHVCATEDLQAAAWSEVPLDPVETNYHRFARAVATGQGMQPDFDTGARLQAVLDGVFLSDAEGRKISVAHM